MKHTLRNLTYAAMSLALCLVLPFFTGQIPQIGAMLCPMHLPVLLAGFLCGPWWAAGVGAVAPLLRFFLFLVLRNRRETGILLQSIIMLSGRRSAYE